MGMADLNAAGELLYAGISPGPVDLAEFNDWYDNEHIPVRVALPGWGATTRYRAADGLKPEWLALYEIASGTLGTPEYKALWKNASEREKRVFSLYRAWLPVARAAEWGEMEPRRVRLARSGCSSAAPSRTESRWLPRLDAISRDIRVAVWHAD